jgi:hypothetical protein
VWVREPQAAVLLAPRMVPAAFVVFQFVVFHMYWTPLINGTPARRVAGRVDADGR